MTRPSSSNYGWQRAAFAFAGIVAFVDLGFSWIDVGAFRHEEWARWMASLALLASSGAGFSLLRKHDRDRELEADRAAIAAQRPRD